MDIVFYNSKVKPYRRDEYELDLTLFEVSQMHIFFPIQLQYCDLQHRPSMSFNMGLIEYAPIMLPQFSVLVSFYIR